MTREKNTPLYFSVFGNIIGPDAIHSAPHPSTSIWCDGPEKLSEFLDYTQKFSDSRGMNSKIKFEVNQSTEFVNFLDVTVRLIGTTLETTLYSKPTDAHMYLNTSSNHPKHVIKNIPKGQFIRIRRICSNLDKYKRNSAKLNEFLVKRGYNQKSLKSAM